MGVLSSFKMMKLDLTTENMMVLRTSRVTFVLGLLFLIAGLGIIFQIYVTKQFYSMPSFCALGSFVAAFFVLVAAILITYKKNVRVDLERKKIDLAECCILGYRTLAFHFEEIENVELTRDIESFLSKQAQPWVIKIYSSTCDGIKIEKVFTSPSFQETRYVAEAIASAINKNLINSYETDARLIFTRS